MCYAGHMVLLHLVDAFAEGPFKGNPAAVCLLDGPRPEAWMQQLAFELGFSETAYVTRTESGAFSLRWFTPVVEVSLCGHATLASAHVLWSIGRVQGPIAFQTQSGVISCERSGRLIYLDMPRLPVEETPPPIGLLSVLDAHPVAPLRRAGDNYLVELEDEAAVRAVAPDFRALGRVAARGVMITARARKGSEYDFVSRYFAPSVGIDEDPVTGSAHSVLAPYWAERLGKQTLRAHQLSQRGGVLELSVRESSVRMGGRAVTIFTGAVVV